MDVNMDILEEVLKNSPIEIPNESPQTVNADGELDLISPFVRSTQEVYRAMLACQCDVGEPQTSPEGHTMEMVTAMIGLSGHIVGSLSISFPMKTAVNILDRILGVGADEADDFVRDAIGELANTIAGKGKRELSQFELDLGLPQVIVGNDYSLFSPRWAQHHWLSLDSEIGTGTLDVGFDLHRSGNRR